MLKLFLKHGADERIEHPDGLSLKRLLLGFGWSNLESFFVPDVRQDPRDGPIDRSKVPGRMVPNEGGEHYKAAVPILESVTKWRQRKTFAEVCTVFFDVKKFKDKSTAGNETTASKRVRTTRVSEVSFLEVNVDILRCVHSFL